MICFSLFVHFVLLPLTNTIAIWDNLLYWLYLRLRKMSIVNVQSNNLRFTTGMQRMTLIFSVHYYLLFLYSPFHHFVSHSLNRMNGLPLFLHWFLSYLHYKISSLWPIHSTVFWPLGWFNVAYQMEKFPSVMVCNMHR